MLLTTRTFRIFISSTFEDLIEERNALQLKVFPRLRKLCEAHGARIQPVDLRWGVPDEAVLDQRRMEICFTEIDRCHRSSTRPNFIILVGNRYGPTRDVIQLPPFEAFKDKESYYGTALHELTRWTKAKHRLDRDFSGKRFGDHGYAREELVAELGAAFLCADLGIWPEIRQDHADYLGHWLSVLKEDKRAIFSAAAHAQRVADYLSGLQQRQAQAA